MERELVSNYAVPKLFAQNNKVLVDRNYIPIIGPRLDTLVLIKVPYCINHFVIRPIKDFWA